MMIGTKLILFGQRCFRQVGYTVIRFPGPTLALVVTRTNHQHKSVPPPQNVAQSQLRQKFFIEEKEFEKSVDYTKLDAELLAIHQAHAEAVQKYHFTYDDPKTGLKVMTRLRHYLKGSCCGNACRHCIYNHENVDKDIRRRKSFNTAFWVDNPDTEESEKIIPVMEEEWSVNNDELHQYLNVLMVLIKETGDIIASAISSQKNVEIDEKESIEGNSSAVLTETDLKVEKHLIDGLKKNFPDHQFIGEESGTTGSELTNAPTWIIDPIDGTMNFVHSNPLVCTSVGLTVNKKLMIGVVNCPLIGKLYSAVKGEGAFCNQVQIKVSNTTDISKAMVIMELPAGGNEEKKDIAIHNLQQLLGKAHAVRAPGPAALDIAWIGSGSADVFFHQGIHSWDMAAGAIIVKEAGGFVTSTEEGEFDLMSRGIVAASSPKLAEQLKSFIKIYETPRDQATPVYPL